MAEKIGRVPVREQDPKVRAHNFEEVCYGYDEQEALLEASRCLNCRNPRCVAKCPVGIRIPEFIAQVKAGEFAEAARVIGVPKSRIMRRHILPNCLPTLLVLFTLNIPASILTESSLSFLGLGIQAPNASWGLMINMGRQYLYSAPWLCFVPGAAIMLIVLAFNFLGNGLLDVLDPRQKKQ